MKKLGFALCFALSLTSFASTFEAEVADEGSQVDTESTLKSLEGDYVIDLVDHHMPKVDSSDGDLTTDKKEAVLSLPFCNPSGTTCDPGFSYFPYSKTTIHKKALTGKDYLLTLKVADGSSTLKYTWKNVKGQIEFINTQYDFSGKIGTLEYSIHKK